MKNNNNWIKDQYIKEVSEQLKNHEADKKALLEIKSALDLHTGKLVDKNFFEKHFLQEGDQFYSWNRTKYSIAKRDRAYNNLNYAIYATPHCSIETATRETAEIKEALNKKIENVESWIKRENDRLADIKPVNEMAIKKEIIAIFEKHGRPAIWDKIIGDYDLRFWTLADHKPE